MAGKKTSSAPGFDPDYFVLPHPVYIIAVPLLLFILAMANLAPNDIPWYFGPLVTFGEYLATQHPVFTFRFGVFVLIVHTLEGVLFWKICSNRGFNAGATVKWTISGFVYGLCSLYRLWPVKPPNKTE
ncbi:uncharacterized protein LOC101856695 [Aplysia californica]|uniref:Transmembrane protein 254 n=1 Tax=Aplysia californica TaxID=6500 RepID=A0ABM0K6C5_APLCA|nr:uncharacterized protein LOC101856695 [Aplysia californica]